MLNDLVDQKNNKADEQSPPLYDQVNTGFVNTVAPHKDIQDATNQE